MTKRIVVLIVVAILPLLVAGGATTTAQSGYCASAEEMVLLDQINSFRQQNGLQPLTLSQPLGVAAQTKASDMASRDYIAHVSPDGQGPRELLNSSGYTYNTAYGENLAAGNESGAATFQQWRNSDSHRSIMLDPRFSAIGIGSDYNPNSTYGWYWAAEFGGVVGEPAAPCGGNPSDPGSTDAIVAAIIAIITSILAG
ncbi:MAG TPA: CAP domain-containing protein [Thermomicrobiales bacterium]|nr:CAP domain-containing protein [Thermomicrobiales bacterium]